MADGTDLLRAAGAVESGPGVDLVHLVTRAPGQWWVTTCPAGAAAADGEPWTRHARPVLAPVTCPDCRAVDPAAVALVDEHVAGQRGREETSRAAVLGFLAWAAEQHPTDPGGATLAVYAGDTRLHPLRADERVRLVDDWLEGTRRLF